jgi:5'-nucleotidase
MHARVVHARVQDPGTDRDGHERVDGRGVPYFWLGFSRFLSNPPQGTDLRAIYDGRISVTPLHLNLTEERARQALVPQLDGAASSLL